MSSEVVILMRIILPLYVTAFILYTVRAIKGPTIPDIILAVDCMSFDIAAFMAILAVYFKSTYLITGAIILALWAYLLDVYVANHLTKKEVGV
ncbi:pH regulation protein F [Thermococcus guaymasensis DSM 11113]|uniref:pH regulation protein F n=1 Tax=Thermococcus guaymasensis DSM 11113 TaxID=1432656 RepID=A0A0X1KKE8_9EURY|nr:monovalent cation/H+ antiporter complex subunit F [Thermococcus guaymasensis]AJC71732.1 pH regulation protein F [Thermococcus guaymasensis DSM 11113]